jgi:hypothetical protein
LVARSRCVVPSVLDPITQSTVLKLTTALYCHYIISRAQLRIELPNNGIALYCHVMNNYQACALLLDAKALVFYCISIAIHIYSVYSYDGKVVTCNLLELSIVKNGACAMLFERPDTPCCIPHLRLRGI